jgi:dienelactone hydrolase
MVFGTAVLLFSGSLSAPTAVAERVTFRSGDMRLTSYLCKPKGAGPFPLVVYNHGGMGDKVGGAPSETCDALAVAGFVGMSPLRRQTRPLSGHIDDVYAGLQYGLELPYVDRQRIGLMGFSRGGLLTLIAATQRADFDAVVVMATAGGRRGQTARIMETVKTITAPVLLLVAQNDTGSNRTQGMNTLQGCRELAQALRASGRDLSYIEYPPYGTDGHTMFYEVGDYWKDVVAFLRKHL